MPFPQAVASKWAIITHANEFDELVKSCAEGLGYDSMNVEDNATPAKRKLGAGQDSLNKKPKNNPKTCNIEDTPGSSLATVKLVGQIPEVILSVHTGGNRMALCNQSDKGQTVVEGSVLFGFGKVGWKRQPRRKTSQKVATRLSP